MSRNAPAAVLLGECCVTSKKRLRGRLGNLPMPLRKIIIQSWLVPSAEYGRTRRDLARAEPILAACTPWNTSLFIPDYGCMPIERLSIRRMRVLGSFPAVLDDLNFKFSRGILPPDPPPPLVCSCTTVQFTRQKGYKRDYRQIANPFIRI